MSYNKTQIYNLALSHMLLSRQIVDVDTDTDTNEVRILNTFWETALKITLQELDLDSLSSPRALELVEQIPDTENLPWLFAYKYPSNCAFLRRIQSGFDIDNEYTHIAKRVAIRNGQKVIYTNQDKAFAEYIPSDVSLSFLSPSAALALSYYLASLAAPGIVGKGAATLKRSLKEDFVLNKSAAQRIDELENRNYREPWENSSFVAARME